MIHGMIKGHPTPHPMAGQAFSLSQGPDWSALPLDGWE